MVSRIALTSIFLTGFSFLFASTANGATTISVASTNTIKTNEEFDTRVVVTASANSDYYLKVRLGDQPTDISKGQTFNPATNSWLTDNASWVNQPSFRTDNNGNWSGTVRARPNGNIVPGLNYLAVRIHNSITSTNNDSTSQAVTITLAPTTQPPSNIPPAQTSQNFTLALNEVMAYPSSGDEWVEIVNRGPDTADLTNWKIDDIDGGSSPTTFPKGTLLASGKFFVLYFASKLNNSDDSARLLKPDGSLAEVYSYKEAVKGKSFAKDRSGNWFLSETASPGATNPDPSEIKSSSTNKTVVKLGSNSKQPSTIPKPENSQVEGVSTSSPLPSNYSTIKAGTKSATPTSLGTKTTLNLPLIFGGLTILLTGSFVFLNQNKAFVRIGDWVKRKRLSKK